MLIIRSSLLVFFVALVGCGPPVKDYTNQITVQSANYKFIDELLDAGEDRHEFNIQVPVWVSYPENEKTSAPYPAIILLHSSWGLSSQESFYANIFKQMGLVVFAIDSFTPRGQSRTSIDQSSVSSAAMIQDAYQVLEYISQQPNIDSTKVAIMGFSKGGIAAFYSQFLQINHAANQGQHSFAAHVGYYPWCGIRLYKMETTGAPVLLQGGDKDIITPIEKCENLIEEELSVTAKSNINIVRHEKARHAFDHPVLKKIPIPISLTAQVPALCDIRQTREGEFIERYTNKTVTGKNIKSILEECSTFNGSAGSNQDATQNALHITKQFLSEHLIK